MLTSHDVFEDKIEGKPGDIDRTLAQQETVDELVVPQEEEEKQEDESVPPVLYTKQEWMQVSATQVQAIVAIVLPAIRRVFEKEFDVPRELSEEEKRRILSSQELRMRDAIIGMKRQVVARAMGYTSYEALSAAVTDPRHPLMQVIISKGLIRDDKGLFLQEEGTVEGTVREALRSLFDASTKRRGA